MNDSTWTCHVCEEERPDDKIDVYTRTKTLDGGVEMQENIRHCNDRDACIEGAQDVHFVNEKFREPTPEEIEAYEKETTPEESDISLAGWIIIVGVIIAIAAIIFSAVKFAPVVAGWLDESINDKGATCKEVDPEDMDFDAEATYSFCTDQGFAASEDIQPGGEGDEIKAAWCAASGWHRAETLVEVCGDFCDASVCAVMRYELPEGAEPVSVENYLAEADAVIDRMIAAKSKMELLADVMITFGGNDYQQLAAFDDKQWLKVYDEMGDDVNFARHKLMNLWAPPPYNSSNPLLDAHGRLMLAFMFLDEAESDIDYGYYEKDPWYIRYGYGDTLDEFMDNIGYARVGLNLAR